MNSSIAQSRRKPVNPLWIAAAAVVTVAGVVAWVVQLTQGMSTVSLSNLTPWGTYIAGFIFFMGLSAGSLVLSSLPVLFDLPRFRPYAKLGAYIALASLIVGGLYIMVDIGKPDRLWRIVRYAHLGSPMLWDLLLTVAYLIVSTVYLRRLMQAKGDDKGLKPLALIVFLAGLADGLTAFVFATQIGREYWYSAVQPIAFFVAAVASAGATILLVMTFLKPSGYVHLECCDLNPISLLTASMLGLSLLLIVSEMVTLAFSRSASATELIDLMIASPVFWVEIVSGVAALLLLLIAPLRGGGTAQTVTSAGLALVHLAAKRLTFVGMGFAVENIDYAGVNIGSVGAAMPTLVEFGVALGLLGLFILLLTVGFNSFQLVDEPRG
ncbi:MAG TPA: polysulfide reductase NrfD [Aggregatilinea sp.]|uniref:NrfD/PsrC family molybdoenzyme membrane anchor subunit n=1 Tax=Aggregatilinea sp. TaxID=2806333 RepID=UPI002CC06182|nr:NrfD/PsrC family molybdoenzyme membrane anchor subunit [Aggregatilinea sp.]HML23988.1 polysulfide reductase NrfD [Aggregatilinea sp.]